MLFCGVKFCCGGFGCGGRGGGLGGVGRGDDLGLGRLIGPTICALIRLVAMHAYMLE